MIHSGSSVNNIHLDPLSTTFVEVVPVWVLGSIRFVRYVAQLSKSVFLVDGRCRRIVCDATATVLVDTGDLFLGVSIGQVG